MIRTRREQHAGTRQLPATRPTPVGSLGRWTPTRCSSSKAGTTVVIFCTAAELGVAGAAVVAVKALGATARAPDPLLLRARGVSLGGDLAPYIAVGARATRVRHLRHSRPPAARPCTALSPVAGEGGAHTRASPDRAQPDPPPCRPSTRAGRRDNSHGARISARPACRGRGGRTRWGCCHAGVS